MNKPSRGILHLVLGFQVLMSGCAPEATPSPTSTPLPTGTPAPTQTPIPSPTIENKYKRVSLMEFMPSRPLDTPLLSFKIPDDFVLVSRYIPTSNTDWDEDFWLSRRDAKLFQNMETYPVNRFFRASVLIVAYDPESKRFMGLPNSADDDDIIQSWEAKGLMVNLVERKDIGDIPILILELVTPYEDTYRSVNHVFIGQPGYPALVIYFYHSFPTSDSKDDEIWDHFKSSLEKIQ